MPMKIREMIRLVEQDGWVQLPGTGTSHRQYKHPVKKGRVTIAGKPGKDLRIGTQREILKQAGLL